MLKFLRQAAVEIGLFDEHLFPFRYQGTVQVDQPGFGGIQGRRSRLLFIG